MDFVFFFSAVPGDVSSFGLRRIELNILPAHIVLRYFFCGFENELLSRENATNLLLSELDSHGRREKLQKRYTATANANGESTASQSLNLNLNPRVTALALVQCALCSHVLIY